MRGAAGGPAHLSELDWAVIVGHLSLSIAVGAFISRKKQATADEYFLAGRNQSALLVAVSLLSGVKSGISYLGEPGYAYQDGAPSLLGFVTAELLAVPIAAYVIMPVFHNLGITTAYEYLELRFCTAMRTLAAAIFVVKTAVYLGIVLYAPAIILSTMTDVPVWACIVTTGTSALLYTLKGGMRAVTWTDAMQSVAMIAVAAVTLGIAVQRCGGLAAVWDVLREEGKLVEPSFFGFHPLTPLTPSSNRTGANHTGPREDFWAFAVGTTVNVIAQHNTDQLAVQRLLTIGDLAECQKGIVQNGFIHAVGNVLIFGIGLVCAGCLTRANDAPASWRRLYSTTASAQTAPAPAPHTCKLKLSF